MIAMVAHGGYLLAEHELKKLDRVIFKQAAHDGTPGKINPEWIGKDASAILGSIGVMVDQSIRLLVAEVPKEHSLVWTEQMMPIMPVAGRRCAGSWGFAIWPAGWRRWRAWACSETGAPTGERCPRSACHAASRACA